MILAKPGLRTCGAFCLDLYRVVTAGAGDAVLSAANGDGRKHHDELRQEIGGRLVAAAPP